MPCLKLHMEAAEQVRAQNCLPVRPTLLGPQTDLALGDRQAMGWWPIRGRLPGGMGWSLQLPEAPRGGSPHATLGPVCIHRQLSEDLLLAREALEKEIQLRRQLQQEKEELLYRVLGADASPAFPLASVTPTEVSFLAT